MAIKHLDLTKDLVFPLWNTRTFEVVDRYFSPDADIRTTFLSGIGPEALKKSVADTFEIFPDFKIKIDDIVQEDNKLTYKWYAKGTQIKPILGFQPTGKSLEFSGVVFGEINNGLVTLYHSYSNILQVLHAATAETISNNTADEASLLEIRKRIYSNLAAREIECLELWVKGCSMKESAKQLGDVSTRTIQTYRESIKYKLNIRNYQELLSLFQEINP